MYNILEIKLILWVKTNRKEKIMGVNKSEQAKKTSKKPQIEDNNDQLGENASEEYKSEEYSNAMKNESKKKNLK